jgi:hypothetical protein
MSDEEEDNFEIKPQRATVDEKPPYEEPKWLYPHLTLAQRLFCEKYVELGGKGHGIEAMALVEKSKKVSDLTHHERAQMSNRAMNILRNLYAKTLVEYLESQMLWEARVSRRNVMAQKSREAFLDRTAIRAKVKQTGDFSLLTDDERSIVEGWEEDVKMIGKGDDAEVVRILNLKFCPKGAATTKLMEHKGLLNQDGAGASTQVNTTNIIVYGQMPQVQIIESHEHPE